ncbi:MAG TPA: hypothetical protein VMH33_01175 [Solirubrobacterales bacterium]|nr:hypothetical protein [Solirubrobacterales bacterium]
MAKREAGPPPLGPGGAVWESVGAARDRAAFFLQRRVAWPVEDRFEKLGWRGLVGVVGGGGLVLAAVVAALLIAGPGSSGSDDATAATASTDGASVAHEAAVPPTTPKEQAKQSAPTLHGAAPSFKSAKGTKVGVGEGKALGGTQAGGDGEAPAPRGATASAGDASAATAKIGSTPSTGALTDSNTEVGGTELLSGPPAPKAAKQVARHFAEAFVVYETGGTDAKVRSAFGATTTRQLAKSLLHRPPRQPADVKVPRAKVVNVVAGPSEGGVYTVSVSLLRVGVTSELRLEMQQGPGKKWQVTNVLG